MSDEKNFPHMHAAFSEGPKKKKEELVQSVRVHVDEGCTQERRIHSHDQGSKSMPQPSPIGKRIRIRKEKNEKE